MTLKSRNNSTFILTFFLCLFISWIGNRFGNSIYQAYNNSSNALDMLITSMDDFKPLKNPIPDFNIGALMGMILVPILFYCFYEYYQYNRKNYRQKEEHGSARYGKFKDIEWMKDKREEHDKRK